MTSARLSFIANGKCKECTKRIKPIINEFDKYFQKDGDFFTIDPKYISSVRQSRDVERIRSIGGEINALIPSSTTHIEFTLVLPATEVMSLEKLKTEPRIKFTTYNHVIKMWLQNFSYEYSVEGILTIHMSGVETIWKSLIE